jgi:hypothetical protein
VEETIAVLRDELMTYYLPRMSTEAENEFGLDGVGECEREEFMISLDEAEAEINRGRAVRVMSFVRR